MPWKRMLAYITGSETVTANPLLPRRRRPRPPRLPRVTGVVASNLQEPFAAGGRGRTPLPRRRVLSVDMVRRRQ
jgi:hypothetical protein